MPRTAPIYYALTIGSNWGWFLGPFYPLFLLSLDLSLTQASAVLAAYFITTLLFEVPTGAVADVFGRRTAFLLSCLTRASAFLLYFFADSFADCITAEVIDAFGTALSSGALEAWAVDQTQAEGDSQPTTRLFARANTWMRSMMALLGLAGVAIATIDLRLPWLVGATGYASTFVFAWFFMRETRPAAATTMSAHQVLTHGLTTRAAAPVHSLGSLVATAGTSVVRTLHEALGEIVHSSTVRVLCLLTVATAFGVMPVYFAWPAFVRDLVDSDLLILGLVWSAISLASALGSATVPRALRTANRPLVLALTEALRGVGIGLVALATSVGQAALGLVLLEFGLGLSSPIFQAWVNEHVGNERRATALSMVEMSFTGGAAVGLLILGRLAEMQGFRAAWLISAVLLVALAPTFILIRWQEPVAPHAVPQASEPGLPD